MQKIAGILLPTNPDSQAYDLAELFCNLFADQQAVFFNRIAELSNKWPTDASFQWRSMQEHLSPEGKQVIDAMKEHTE